MKKTAALLLVLGTLVLLPGLLFAEELTGRDIMMKANDTPLATGMSADVTMILINKRGQQRIRQIRMMSKDDEGVTKSIMFFLSPADVKGTGFLTIEASDGHSDMWLFLPALNKVRRIVSSGKSSSFMGSDITYSDLEGQNRDDFTYTRLDDGVFNGQNCYMVEATPRTQQVRKETGYGRRVFWISKDSLLPVQVHSFDTRSVHTKTMIVSEATQSGQTWIPTHIEVQDLKKQSKTIMKIENIEFEPDIDDRFFSQQALRRGL